MMMQFLLKQRGGWLEERSSAGSTDCTLNNSLLDGQAIEQRSDSSSSRQASNSRRDKCESNAIGNAGARMGGHRSSFSFSSFSRHVKSKDSISPCCGMTTAETTVSSSYSSQIGIVGVGSPRSRRSFPDIFHSCSFCFWPTVYSVEERPHRDCFVAADCVDPSDWHTSYSVPFVYRKGSDNAFSVTEHKKMNEPPKECDDKTEETDIFAPLSKTILSIPKLPLPHILQKNDELKVDVSQVCQMKNSRLTPHTNNSKASFTEYTKTVTSTMNTQHRRTDDISMGFFTAQTLDAIYSSPTKATEGTGTPRNQDCCMNIVGNNRSAFQTPANRARVDSDTFRRTMKVVTCEKRKIDDSEVSPIDSDDGFSPIMESRKKSIVAMESLPPGHQSPMNGSHKKLLFDVGSVRRYDTPNVLRSTQSDGIGRNLFQDFASEQVSEHLSPLSEFGLSVMKSLQTIVHGRPHVIVPAGYEADKENTPGNTPACAQARIASTSNPDTEEALWQDRFLRKSSSFLKALRRSGRMGKVLIQGWVAFREAEVSWKEIIRKPKRFDFRYIILLDDMPLLHIFSPRQKQKKLMPKHDLLQNCLSVNITEDIAIKVKLVSKEFGNEVFIKDDETGRCLYSFLPIPMPRSVFLDKHQSRLAKGELLKSVFEPFKKSVTFASHDIMTESKPCDHQAMKDQFDVARHLFFVLDCAIKFPLGKNGSHRSSVLKQ